MANMMAVDIASCELVYTYKWQDFEFDARISCPISANVSFSINRLLSRRMKRR